MLALLERLESLVEEFWSPSPKSSLQKLHKAKGKTFTLGDASARGRGLKSVFVSGGDEQGWLTRKGHIERASKPSRDALYLGDDAAKKAVAYYLKNAS